MIGAESALFYFVNRRSLFGDLIDGAIALF
jgi:hypothetical protein